MRKVYITYVRQPLSLDIKRTYIMVKATDDKQEAVAKWAQVTGNVVLSISTN
jgi:hypothetical protein